MPHVRPIHDSYVRCPPIKHSDRLHLGILRQSISSYPAPALDPKSRLASNI